MAVRLLRGHHESQGRGGPRRHRQPAARLLATLLWVVVAFAPQPLLGSVAAAGARNVSSLSPFQQAKVWVNTSSGVYHCPGTRYYGNTKAGTYLSEAQARAKAYRPAYGRICGSVVADSGSESRQHLKTVLPPRGKVWVNTSSGVYHCSGTRYYGNTKNGKYMSEADALSAGNRPAYGRGCV